MICPFFVIMDRDNALTVLRRQFYAAEIDR